MALGLLNVILGEVDRKLAQKIAVKISPFTFLKKRKPKIYFFIDT